MTVLAVFVLFVSLSSCQNAGDVQSDIDKLKTERSSVENDVSNLSLQKSEKEKEIAKLEEKLKELKIYDSGQKPKYILKIHLVQSHFSLSISKHIKDAMNAIDFELPVDKEFYDNVSKGTKIVDEFRTGSLILYGSIGDWGMTIRNKEVRTVLANKK